MKELWVIENSKSEAELLERLIAQINEGIRVRTFLMNPWSSPMNWGNMQTVGPTPDMVLINLDQKEPSSSHDGCIHKLRNALGNSHTYMLGWVNPMHPSPDWNYSNGSGSYETKPLEPTQLKSLLSSHMG